MARIRQSMLTLPAGPSARFVSRLSQVVSLSRFSQVASLSCLSQVASLSRLSQVPLSGEYGTYKTVVYGTYKTVVYGTYKTYMAHIRRIWHV